jgi:hypothetical protein
MATVMDTKEPDLRSRRNTDQALGVGGMVFRYRLLFRRKGGIFRGETLKQIRDRIEHLV